MPIFRGPLENRSLYYWAKAYAGQLSEGSKYSKLYPVICINILDFELPRLEKVHSLFLIQDQAPPHRILSEHLMLHFLNLGALKQGNQSTAVAQELRNWLEYFNKEGTDMKGLQTILEQDQHIAEAHHLYQSFTANDEMRQRYEARQKFLHDIASLKEDSYEEGREKGREEGLQRGRLEAARTMLAEGLPIQSIAKFTGLSEEEIQKL